MLLWRSHENYEFYFRDFIKKKWYLEQGKENPFYQPDMNIHSLPLRTKVEMLQALCDYRLTAEDVPDKLKVRISIVVPSLHSFLQRSKLYNLLMLMALVHIADAAVFIS